MRVAAVILIIVSAVACTAPAPSVSAEVGTLEVTVLAGPVCPVETQEPDPACDPRPVAGAQLFVSPGDGTDIVVAEATSGERLRAVRAAGRNVHRHGLRGLRILRHPRAGRG